MYYFEIGFGISPYLGAEIAIVEDYDQITHIYPLNKNVESILSELKLTHKHHLGIGIYFEIRLTVEEAKKNLLQLLNCEIEYV